MFMRRGIYILLAFMLLVLSGCSIKDDRLFQNSPNGDATTSVSDANYTKEVKYEYKISPNDRISVTVYVQAGSGSQQMNSILATSDITRQGVQNQDASASGLLVTQKGTINLPLIGSVKVVGLTEDEASKALMAKYKKFIRHPYVVVTITNQRIIVVGEVQKPGVIPIVNGTMNLMEVIARSGYFTQDASRTDIKIIRGDLRHPSIRNINLTDAHSLLASSLLLQPNDIVYVEARQMSGFNKAFAETQPFFKTISAILNPFVQRTIILNHRPR